MADMSKMKAYCDFKASMICLFRVPGVKISRHASGIRKKYYRQSFYKGKGKWWSNYQISDAAIFDDFKGSDYQLSKCLKPLDCYTYVIELRRVCKIY